MPCLSFMSEWFVRKRGLATGIMFAGEIRSEESSTPIPTGFLFRDGFWGCCPSYNHPDPSKLLWTVEDTQNPFCRHSFPRSYVHTISPTKIAREPCLRSRLALGAKKHALGVYFTESVLHALFDGQYPARICIFLARFMASGYFCCLLTDVLILIPLSVIIKSLRRSYGSAIHNPL